MKKFKLTVHPLFIAFGIYFAFLGKVFSFLIFTFSCLIHELGHSYVAESKGYKLKRIVLMPYGAIVRGDLSEMTYQEEVVIALAGPFLSLFIAVFFVSFWWLVPDFYPYTELCVLANLTIATINLLPSYPLDGGRVLLATLSCFMKRKKAVKISKLIGVLSAVLIFALFIYSLVMKKTNFSILFFSLFMLFGNLFVDKDLDYERIKSYFSLGDLKKGKKINKIAINKDVTVRELKSLYKNGELLECYLYDEKGRLILTLLPEEVIKIFSTSSIYGKVIDEYKKV